MGNDERRAQKKREKQKKKRDAARATRGSRPAPTAAGTARSPGLDGAERWPAGECYLSEHWHEQGARVHAAFVRAHSDGRLAAAFFEVDLLRDGVVGVLARAGVSEGAIQGEMARRSELTGKAMLVAEPALVAKVVRTGLAWGRTNGSPDPAGLSEALGLLGDEDGTSAPQAVLTGEPPPPPEKRRSLLGRLFGG